jgi:hypothetical protein
MKFKIVVARYNENVSWTNLFSNVVIYNKGEQPLTNYNNVKKLNNVGREGHTYFTHIYENYDNLDDYTAFVQGYPFDHSNSLIQQLIKLQIDCDQDFVYLSDKIRKCSLYYCVEHPGLPLQQVYNHLFPESPQPSLFEFTFGAGAQFVVSKERIRRRPRDFYLKVIQLLEKEKNPIEGFVIERFHGLIFSDIKRYSIV